MDAGRDGKGQIVCFAAGNAKVHTSSLAINNQLAGVNELSNVHTMQFAEQIVYMDS